MDKETEQTLMEVVPFGKRQCLASKARQTLAKGIEPTLDVVGLPFLLTHHAVTLGIKNVGIGLPMITEGGTAAVIAGNASPQLQRTRFAAIPNPVSYHLSRSTTQGQPQPALLPLAAHKRP